MLAFASCFLLVRYKFYKWQGTVNSKTLELNFGQTGAGCQVPVNIPLVNHTQTKLHIEIVKVSCGCVSVFYPSGKEISPNSTLSVVARINTQGKSGVIKELVIFEYSNGQKCSALISGEVIKELDVSELGNVSNPIMYGHVEDRHLILSWNNGRLHRITNVLSSDSTSEVRIVPTQSGIYDLIVHPIIDELENSWSDVIEIDTESPLTPRYFLPVTANVIHELISVPAFISLGQITDGKNTCDAKFSVQCLSADFDVKRITLTGVNNIITNVTKTSSGRVDVVVLISREFLQKFHTETKKEIFLSEIRVETDLKEDNVLRIPVIAALN